MALQKQPFNINFAQGLDTKTDKFQVQAGKFLALQNSIFDKGGLLQKRNGFGNLAALPDSTYTFLTTLNDNLTAIGSSLAAYSANTESWTVKGQIQPLALSTLPLIRSSLNQTQADSVIASNGLICTAYTEIGGTTSPQYKYVITDGDTGQNVVAPTVLSSSASGSPRTFVLGRYFIILFTSTIGGAPHLQYLAVNIMNPNLVVGPIDITTQYTPASTVAFDAVVYGNSMFIAWNGNDGGGAIRMEILYSNLTQSSVAIFAGRKATMMSLAVDLTTLSPVIYASFWDSASTNGYTLAVDQNLATILAPTQTITTLSVANITCVAHNGSATIFYERNNNYSYDAAIPTHFLATVSITSGGSVGSTTVFRRSVGLASKAFLFNDEPHMLAVYGSAYQPSYFLLDQNANVIAKLAYSNASGYYTTGLPGVNINGELVQIAYLIKDLIEGINKNLVVGNTLPVYSQTGINLGSFTIHTTGIVTAEIGGTLNISGGMVWSYDGYKPVEQGFNLWPDSVEVTTSGAGGSLSAQQYYYMVTYEWTDNNGNVNRSAPSIPVTITTVGATSSNTINVPTLRLTYKTTNPVQIVIYRWSVAQQTFYRITSRTAPLLNNTAVDSVAYVDTQADSAIIGNPILYTTGGVIENIGAPAASSVALFQSRLFLIDAEDQNLLWFSKQVIENTPVEMSDLLTIYVAPTTSAQGNTGVMKALSALDDKLIIFKKDAMYYINGVGPDNTGANNQFSEPIFITATVGCDNQQSIVFMPQGLMFQSDKGIWLLSRGLETSYIGAPVEEFTTDATVLSAINVPGTNQVRFTMDSGITLMYDYYYGQWGTFVNIPAISSTLNNSLPTYINASGSAFQETPGKYLDASNPVLMSFTTAWFNLAGLQGFERAYYFYMLATYLSPHKLNISIAYDYNEGATQYTTISPDNFHGFYGDDPLYGDGDPYGGGSNIENWRVFLQKQKCTAFRIRIDEIYDPSFGVIAGAGLTISGLNLVVGLKKGYRVLNSSNSVG